LPVEAIPVADRYDRKWYAVNRKPRAIHHRLEVGGVVAGGENQANVHRAQEGTHKGAQPDESLPSTGLGTKQPVQAVDSGPFAKAQGQLPGGLGQLLGQATGSRWLLLLLKL